MQRDDANLVVLIYRDSSHAYPLYNDELLKHTSRRLKYLSINVLI